MGAPAQDPKESAMALDPQVKAVIDLVIKSGRPAYNQLSPKDARQLFRETRPASTPTPPATGGRRVARRARRGPRGPDSCAAAPAGRRRRRQGLAGARVLPRRRLGDR